MDFPNSFIEETGTVVLARLEKLTNETKPEWGKMNAAQMLAHLNVAYDIAYEKTLVKKPGFLMSFMLKKMIKPIVVGVKPYKKNSRTAPSFLISDKRDFSTEKQALISNVINTSKKGEAFFEGKHSISFGELSANEWNNMFYKHLDHHFKQFNI